MGSLQPLLLAVAATGIAVGIVVPAVWLFSRPRPPLAMQYRLVLIEVMFGLTASMALLFGIDSSLSASVPVEFRVAGPFAAFLGSLLLVFYTTSRGDPQEAADRAAVQQIVTAVQSALPERLAGVVGADLGDRLVARLRPEVVELLTRTIEEAEVGGGWVSYDQLKRQLDGFEEINRKEEEYFVRNLLGAGYSPSADVKVEEATITTAFLYLREKESVVKLQRVRGRTSARPAKVRFRSFSSYGTRGVKSVILIAERSDQLNIRQAEADAETAGRDLDSRAELVTVTFDYLIISEYKEYPDHEDYLLVDPSRFCSEGRAASMSFAVASTHKPIRQPEAWMMRRPQAVAGGKFPLLFHKMPGQPAVGWDGVLADLAPWATCLDNALRDNLLRGSSPDVDKVARAVRETVIRAVVDAGLTAGLDPPPSDLGSALKVIQREKAYHLKSEAVADTLLVLFTWA